MVFLLRDWYDYGMTGSQFKQWRSRVGLTQARVAELLEVTDTTIYRWEHDKAPISRAIELALKQIESENKKETRR